MGVNLGKNSPFWHFLKHIVIPSIFVFGIPISTFLLVLHPLPGGIAGNFKPSILLGNKFSWQIVAVFTLWCLITLKIPSKVYHGPQTSFGLTPTYASNGFFFFCLSSVLFALLNYVDSSLSQSIYDNFPYILGSINILSLTLCLYLWFNGRKKTEDPVLRVRLPVIFEFYRGMELHPRIFGVDIKQLVNCRLGLGMWLLLPWAFFVTSYQRNGLDVGMLVNVLLQFVYLGKFYWWETGYFTTLDITMDRAGFYLSWGCLSFVPSFYTFSTYYLVQHPTVTGAALNAVFFVVGLLAIYLNYAVDRQKEVFINRRGDCKIWGKQAKCIEGTYKGRPVKLMVCGFWAIARHLNYDFELLLALFWNLPACGLGCWPFAYNVFLFILLVHRVYRDEDKCQAKYGPYWKQYCHAVPYRLIPHVY